MQQAIECVLQHINIFNSSSNTEKSTKLVFSINLLLPIFLLELRQESLIVLLGYFIELQVLLKQIGENKLCKFPNANKLFKLKVRNPIKNGQQWPKMGTFLGTMVTLFISKRKNLKFFCFMTKISLGRSF